MHVVHADRALAERIETSVAKDLALYAQACAAVDPEASVATAEVAGGLALFVAPGSPVNMLFGAGFAGPVTPADLNALDAFFAAHGTRGAVSLCPLADASFALALSARGWIITGFENVLARALEPGLARSGLPEAAPGIRVHIAETPAERAAWAGLSARAFCAPEAPDDEVTRLSRAAAVRDDVALFAASVGAGDAAAGALWVDG
jgi:hypothetical protein